VISIDKNKSLIPERKCINCDNSATIFRRQSGQYLCTQCFHASIEKIINKTISKFKMLKPDDLIIVAVSGGKDSLTLLHNLIQIQKKTYNSNPLIALSIDEGIDSYRRDSIDLARQYCHQNNIKHEIISFKSKIGKTLDEIVHHEFNSPNRLYACNYCSIIRRRLLNDAAKALGGTVMALGHNLTDLAETFLMNILQARYHLIKGQYPYKQRSEEIESHFIKKITPLMKIPEEEIEVYAKTLPLNYHEQHCKYREQDPILRKRVLAFIEDCKRYSPEIEYNLFKGFLKISENLYHHNTQFKLSACPNCGYPSFTNKLCSYCQLLQVL
jgi:uncharacterized protein (TIGR00269 family)